MERTLNITVDDISSMEKWEKEALFKTLISETTNDFKIGHTGMRKIFRLILLNQLNKSFKDYFDCFMKEIYYHNMYANNPCRNTQGREKVISKLCVYNPKLIKL